jgi:transcriptional regulator GlxA family with amidase domain
MVNIRSMPSRLSVWATCGCGCQSTRLPPRSFRIVAATISARIDTESAKCRFDASMVRCEVRLRALQYAFRRRYDTTPMGYLRRVRLERAHQQLQAADPAAGVTVGQIARRWGWANQAKFAAAYRMQYGMPPSRTLRA